MFGSDDPVPMMIEGDRPGRVPGRAGRRSGWCGSRSAFPVVSVPAGALVAADRYVGRWLAGRARRCAAGRPGGVAAGVAGLLPGQGPATPAPGCGCSVTYPAKWATDRTPPRSGRPRTRGPAQRVHLRGAEEGARVTPAGIVQGAGGDPDRAHPRRLRPHAPKRWRWRSGSAKPGSRGPGPSSVWVELHRTDVLTATVRPLPVKASNRR